MFQVLTVYAHISSVLPYLMFHRRLPLKVHRCMYCEHTIILHLRHDLHNFFLRGVAAQSLEHVSQLAQADATGLVQVEQVERLFQTTTLVLTHDKNLGAAL